MEKWLIEELAKNPLAWIAIFSAFALAITVAGPAAGRLIREWRKDKAPEPSAEVVAACPLHLEADSFVTKEVHDETWGQIRGELEQIDDRLRMFENITNGGVRLTEHFRRAEDLVSAAARATDAQKRTNERLQSIETTLTTLVEHKGATNAALLSIAESLERIEGKLA